MGDSPTKVLYDYKDPINICAALIMFLIGSCGVVWNVLMVLVFCKDKSERTSFNLICLFRALANIYILISIFFTDFIPVTLLGYSVYTPYAETVLIAVTNSIYVVNEYITIFVAANRFFAIFFPLAYSKFFGIRMTLFYLIAFYVFRGTIFVQQLIENPQTCYYTFDPATLAWSPSEPCFQLHSFFMTFTLCALIVISIVNFATFTRIVIFYKNGPGNQDPQSRLKIKSNINLFFQTLLQDSLFLIDLTSTYKLNDLSTNRVWTFVCGSMIWQCLHSFDGLIMIMFNEKLSQFKKRLSSSTSPSDYGKYSKTEVATID